MASVNPHTRELVFKLVFYGPGLGGKTTTLQYIYAATKAEHRGKMVSLATPTDRTLYFDFLPIRVPRVRGMAVRLQLFTVPGQVYYAATRKLVLSGADGVVFVADSQAGRLDTNQESLDDLQANLAEHNRTLEEIPHTFHWNKRDLSDLVPLEDLDARFNLLGAPSLGTVATRGDGVFEGLERITRLLLKKYESDPKVRIEADGVGAGEGEKLSEDGIVLALRGMEARTEARADAHASESEPQVEAPTKLSAVVPEVVSARASRDVQTSEVVAAGTVSSSSPRSSGPFGLGPMSSSSGAAPASSGPLVGGGTTSSVTSLSPRSGGTISGLAAIGTASNRSGSKPASRAGSAQAPAPASGEGAASASAPSPAPVPAPVPVPSPSRANLESAARGPSEPPGSAPISAPSETRAWGGFSMAELWPVAERDGVKQAESMMAAADAVNAVLACDVLVTRVLASAAGLVGTLDAPRDPAVVSLLLGLDGARYLQFRMTVRAARHREAVTMKDALECFSFALEARRAREFLRR